MCRFALGILLALVASASIWADSARLSSSRQQCAPTLDDHSALIQGQGQAGVPEIFFRNRVSARDDLQLELAAGKHTLTVVCREITRTGMTEQVREISTDVEAGRIYRLHYVGAYRRGECNVEPSVVEIE